MDSVTAASILVIDDDADFRVAIATVLEDAGYRVATAWNGRLGIEHMRKHGLPAVVLLDLEMPIMDGPAFCEEKDRDPVLAQVPVVVLSGHADLGDGLRPPVAEWLRKPVDAAVVLQTIARLARTSGSRREAQALC